MNLGGNFDSLHIHQTGQKDCHPPPDDSINLKY